MKPCAHCVMTPLKIVQVMLYLDIEINSSTKETCQRNDFFYDDYTITQV